MEWTEARLVPSVRWTRRRESARLWSRSRLRRVGRRSVAASYLDRRAIAVVAIDAVEGSVILTGRGLHRPVRSAWRRERGCAGSRVGVGRRRAL